MGIKYKRYPITLLIVLLLAVTLIASPVQLSITNEGIVGLSVNNVVAQEVEEVVELRTETSKTHYLGNSIYAVEAALWPVHYQDEGWQEIDNAWIPATAPWNWEMVQDSYHAYALNQFTYGEIMRFELEGESVAFQPMELQWTNDLSMIQPISMTQNVLVEVTNEPTELLTGMEGSIGSIRWNNAYGSGRHFEFTTVPGKLQTLLQLDAAPPEPLEYIINGGNPVMRQSFIFAPSANLTIYVDSMLWDKNTEVQTVNDIEFRLNGEPVWYLWQARYWDSGNSTEVATTVLRKVGGEDLWLDVLVPYEWLQTAVYPIFIDPDTGATYPGLGSNEDRGGKTAWSNPTYIQAAANYASNSIPAATYSDWLRASDFGFAVPDGATINGVKVQINRKGSIADKVRDFLLYLVGASEENGSATKDSHTYWPTTAATATYGGATDADVYWGLTLTPAVVNDDDFGTRLSAANYDTSTRVAYVYWVQITVYYTEAVCDPYIEISASSWNVNGGSLVDEDSTYNTGLTWCTITNNSGGAVSITIGGTDMIGGGYTWDLSDDASNGDMIYGMHAGLSGGSYNIVVKETGPYNILVSGLADSGTQDFGLQIYTPTVFDDGNSKSGTVTLTTVCD